MCLYIKENTVKVIATVNIPAYKQLSKNGNSLMMDFYYYKFWKNWKVKLNIHQDRFGSSLEQGYHSRMSNNSKCKDHLFIIPKNAEYYIGRENSHLFGIENGYVSNTIIYLGQNNSFNRKLGKLLYNVNFKSPEEMAIENCF